jgi:hypothetical protein
MFGFDQYLLILSFQLFNSHPKLKGIRPMKFSNIYYKKYRQFNITSKDYFYIKSS